MGDPSRTFCPFWQNSSGDEDIQTHYVKGVFQEDLYINKEFSLLGYNAI
jgi:hypothetical protein